MSLTGHRWAKASMDAGREAEIGALVDRFYAMGREDPVIGPVFETHVGDWDRHLATMRDFWTSAMYRTGRYSGRPIEAHRELAEIGAAHFERWLELWEAAVGEVVTSDVGEDLVVFARRMAGAMAARLGA